MDINQEHGHILGQIKWQEITSFLSKHSGILFFIGSLLFFGVVSHFLNFQRIELEHGRLRMRIDKHQIWKERDQLQKERDQLRKERDQLAEERIQLMAERDQMLSERQQLQKERQQIMTKWSKLVKELENMYVVMIKGMENTNANNIGSSYFDYFLKGFTILEYVLPLAKNLFF